MNKLSIDKFDIELSVVATKGKLVGHRVKMAIKAKKHSGIAVLTHELMFADAKDCEDLCHRIRARGYVNLDHWVWTVDKALPFTSLMHAPTARLKTQLFKLEY